MVKKRATIQTHRKSAGESPQLIQRRWVQLLRDETDYLHELSLLLMEARGILPPCYGGDWLSDAKREVIPLWGVLANEEEELGLILIRTHRGIEPNRSLRETRREIALSNTWPVERLLNSLGPEGRHIPIEGGDSLRGTNIALALFADQCLPAPGLTREGMLEALSQEKPLALFIHVPIVGDGESFLYAWSDFEHFRAEIIYADTPEELEIAVWEYRLTMAIEDERLAIEAEGANPAEEMLAVSVPELTGIFDLMVMDAWRYYGVTSPVAEKQRALDVIRGVDGDLVVSAPLKAELEPVRQLATERRERQLDENDGAVILRIEPDSEIMTHIWPQVRAHSHFCMRVRAGDFGLNRAGQPRVRGYLPAPMIEWIVADSLPELYHKTTLHCLRQLLIATGCVRVMAVPLADSSAEPTLPRAAAATTSDPDSVVEPYTEGDEEPTAPEVDHSPAGKPPRKARGPAAGTRPHRRKGDD